MFNRREYMKKYYIKNEEKLRKRAKQWRKNNTEHMKEHNKQYRIENQEHIKKYMKKYNKGKKTKIMKQHWRRNNLLYLKKWRRIHPEHWKIYYEKAKKHIREYIRQRYKTDLKYNLNSKTTRAISLALKDKKAGRKWESLVGYGLDFLVNRLLQTMPRGYNWDDFLKGKLHIDHIIPIRAFVFDKPEDDEFKQCWALDNLRLLTKKENLMKHNKITNPILLGLLLKKVS